MPSESDGWTSDLSINVPRGTTLEEIVGFVIERSAAGDQDPVHAVHTRFGLSEQDGYLAVDRTFGGIERAATRHVGNRPDGRLDPVAATSYRMARQDPSLIASFSPELADEIRDAVRNPLNKSDPSGSSDLALLLILIPVIVAFLVYAALNGH